MGKHCLCRVSRIIEALLLSNLAPLNGGDHLDYGDID